LPLRVRKSVAAVRHPSGPYEYNSAFVHCLREQLEECSAIPEYLSIDPSRLSYYRKPQIQNMVTVTSLIEEWECGKSSIENYYESLFI
jgi:hypothetical protein